VEDFRLGYLTVSAKSASATHVAMVTKILAFYHRILASVIRRRTTIRLGFAMHITVVCCHPAAVSFSSAFPLQRRPDNSGMFAYRKGQLSQQD